MSLYEDDAYESELDERTVMRSIAISLKRIADALHDCDGMPIGDNIDRIASNLTHVIHEDSGGVIALSIADILMKKET